MNKTQLINYQSELLSERDDTIERQERQLQVEYDLVDTLMAQADASDRLHKRLSDQEKARHTAEKKAATEAATLKSIANGLVPIEVLRNHIREEYKTTHNASFVKTDLTVMLDSAKPVDKAILAALLEKPAKLTYTLTPQAFSDFTAQAVRDLAPKFANGGYTTPKAADRVGAYYCGNN